jgi:hypothetical protein
MHDASELACAEAVSAEPRADTSAPERAPKVHHRGSTWADGTVLEAALGLYRQGHSAAQVAAALWSDHQVHVTRNAVIGLMHRLGVKGGGGLAGPSAAGAPRSRLRREPAFAAGGLRSGVARPLWRPRTPPAWRRSVTPPPTAGVPYFEASEAQCPFPLWDEATPIFERQVCGAPRCEPNTRLNHYCAFHARLCFMPRGEPASAQGLSRACGETGDAAGG